VLHLVIERALYLISDNDHYQPEMIKPQDMHDVEIVGRCQIRRALNN